MSRGGASGSNSQGHPASPSAPFWEVGKQDAALRSPSLGSRLRSRVMGRKTGQGSPQPTPRHAGLWGLAVATAFTVWGPVSLTCV